MFHIRATGSQYGYVYLNTYGDYHDQRNISIVISPEIVAQLERQPGQPVEQYFHNKTVRVTGAAKRVIIDFNCNGIRTSAYYYQTHVELTAPDRITALPAS